MGPPTGGPLRTPPVIHLTPDLELLGQHGKFPLVRWITGGVKIIITYYYYGAVRGTYTNYIRMAPLKLALLSIIKEAPFSIEALCKCRINVASVASTPKLFRKCRINAEALPQVSHQHRDQNIPRTIYSYRPHPIVSALTPPFPPIVST